MSIDLRNHTQHQNRGKWKWTVIIIGSLGIFCFSWFSLTLNSHQPTDESALNQIASFFNQIDLKRFDVYMLQHRDDNHLPHPRYIGYQLLANLQSIKVLKIGHSYFYDEKWIDPENHQYHVRQSNGYQTIYRQYPLDHLKQTAHTVPIVFDEIYHQDLVQQFCSSKDDNGLMSHFDWHHALSLKYQLPPQKRSATCLISDASQQKDSQKDSQIKIQEAFNPLETIILDDDHKIQSIQSRFIKSTRLTSTQKTQSIKDWQNHTIKPSLISLSSLSLPTINIEHDLNAYQIKNLKTRKWIIWEVKGIPNHPREKWINSRQEIKALHTSSSYPYQWITYQNHQPIKQAIQTLEIQRSHLKASHQLSDQESKLVQHWTDTFIDQHPAFRDLISRLRQGEILAFEDMQALIKSLISAIHGFLHIKAMPFMTDLQSIFEFRQGDCNEFSHFFSAIAWDLGIPNQIILGVVPIDDLLNRGILQMGYHAWVGVMSLEGWIEVDPLWQEVPVGVGHLGMSLGWEGYEEIQRGLGGLELKLNSP